MSYSLSKSLRLSSSLKMNKEAELVQKQGIVSILGSDFQRTSLRRTLSADMSSKKWLTQDGLGFSPIKKIASSEALAVSVEENSSSSSEEEYDERKEMEEKPTQLDSWSSIISEKAAESKSEPLPPPYIHPLVKSSASSLSKKSLEVCTESLGSETGSDGFSSYTPSETSDSEEDKEKEEEKEQQVPQTLEQEFDVVNYNYGGVGRKSPPRSFPPPLLSLSRREGASLSMRSRRDNGRLVLEAVSVPSQNNFHAQRQDGRLVLTFVPKNLEQKEMIMEDFEEFDDFETENYDDEEEDHEEEEEEEEERVEKAVTKLASEVINVHRLAVMMKPQMAIAKNKNPWLKNFNELVNFEKEEEEVAEEPITLAQSLPPLPCVARLIRAAPAAAASFNAYEYCWRANPPPPPPLKNCKKLKANEQQQRLLVRGNKGGCLVPLLRGCKEPRRSLVFWEPQCIATS